MKVCQGDVQAIIFQLRKHAQFLIFTQEISEILMRMNKLRFFVSDLERQKSPRRNMILLRQSFENHAKLWLSFFFTSHPSQKNKNSIKKKKTLFSLPVLSFIVFFCVNYQQNKS
jgi:hypothetical protein